ncbi:GPW/gp25 family protein [Actinoplanes sp. CA-015351]|uniref:GPW/gp25 family protein n=1 Tax=Actinoplanes sp. CA-015351 TaxID=3239897 RepID=UPI003D98022D
MRDFLGKGWAFPIAATTSRGPSFAEKADKIRQSIWLILSTAKGERPFDPDFGAGIHDLVFSANTAGLRGLVAADVRDALTRWEPRVDVLDVRVETPADARNRLIISIGCRIRANNAALNLVYPFFLTEGVGLAGGPRAD